LKVKYAGEVENRQDGAVGKIPSASEDSGELLRKKNFWMTKLLGKMRLRGGGSLRGGFPKGREYCVSDRREEGLP